MGNWVISFLDCVMIGCLPRVLPKLLIVSTLGDVFVFICNKPYACNVYECPIVRLLLISTFGCVCISCVYIFDECPIVRLVLANACEGTCVFLSLSDLLTCVVKRLNSSLSALLTNPSLLLTATL